MTPDSKMLTGQSEDHLVVWDEKRGIKIHRDAEGPLRKMAEFAGLAGLQLEVASGFRSFSAQLKIWNEKATGKRPLLDEKGHPLDFARLTSEQIVFAILRWSALPGASRHHWGSDIDVYDPKAMPQGYQLRLVPEETEKGGMFAPLHEWLDWEMKNFQFFRPYDKDRGGVSPERWHLSFAPVSLNCSNHLTEELVGEVIGKTDLELKNTVLSYLPEIYRRYISAVGNP